MHFKWSEIAPLKPKLRTYCMFKDSINTENYLLKNMSRHKRSIFSQFRIGILPLEIESGRYTRKSLDERICKLCKTDIEDEIHFLCNCISLVDIRMKYLQKLNIANTLQTIDIFCQIMNHDNCIVVINFVYEMWNKRKNTLFM